MPETEGTGPMLMGAPYRKVRRMRGTLEPLGQQAFANVQGRAGVTPAVSPWRARLGDEIRRSPPYPPRPLGIAPYRLMPEELQGDLVPRATGGGGGKPLYRMAPAPSAFNGEDVMRILQQIGDMVRRGVSTAQGIFGQVGRDVGAGAEAARRAFGQGGALPTGPAQPLWKPPQWLNWGG